MMKFHFPAVSLADDFGLGYCKAVSLQRGLGIRKTHALRHQIGMLFLKRPDASGRFAIVQEKTD